MLRVLIVINRNIANGGIEMYLANMIENMDLSGMNIDIFVPGVVSSQYLASKFNRYGCTIFEQAIIGNKVKRMLCFIYKVCKFLRHHDYDIIHVNTGNLMQPAAAANIAKAFGIPCRIVHSHNAYLKGNIIKKAINSLLHTIIISGATELVSCSKAAAASMFGSPKTKTVILARNGIDTSKFAFCPATRHRVRQQLRLETCFVIGHVGRFAKQKNHKFLIKVFKRIAEKNTSARLLLIGEGPLEDAIRQMVDACQLTDRVIFLGTTDMVEEYMCAMDIFVLPSLYEGLPVVGVEAQASGLPCIVSDTVTEEVRLTEQVEFLSLEASLDIWAEKILNYHPNKYCIDRYNTWREVREMGYDSSDTAQMIHQLYERAMNVNINTR